MTPHHPLAAEHLVVLNVDDYEPGRYAVTRILQLQQYTVREAASGAEALDVAFREHPDVVLLDVNLPDMSGFEVCRRIKQNPATAHIPVLHVSATSFRPEDRTRGLNSGADNYLVEPVEPEVLIASIKAAVRTRRAEEAVLSMASEWQTTFDAINDGIALLDADGRVIRFNRSLAQLLGVTPAEIQGKYSWKLWPPSLEPADRFPFLRMLESRRREEMEIQLGGRWLHVSVDPVLDETGAISGAAYVVSDITQRKRLEDQFHRAQRYESIGQLAGGVAHDFNNLLTCILGNASLAITDLKETDPLRERIEEVIHASEKAATLTRQLLAYSGKGRFVVRPMNLSRATGDLKGLLTASISRKIELRLELAEPLPDVECDLKQFEQLLLNLVLNAGEAIGDAPGRIVIRTAVEELTTGQAGEFEAGRYVLLEVSDNGPGMDEATRAQLFEPFFTTKLLGRGLGLPAVAGIVRGHKGFVRVESEPNAGATFRIFLPEARPKAAAVVSPKPKGSILVVDDEVMVRRVAHTALSMRGYEVLLASDGREAVDMMRKLGEQVAVVLMDLMMPVMGGEEATEEIRRLRPDIVVIASSGFDVRQAAARFGGRGFNDFLQKPYTSRQLNQMAEKWLSGGGKTHHRPA